MKISEEVRQLALDSDRSEQDVIEEGLKEKGQEFLNNGAELYS